MKTTANDGIQGLFIAKFRCDVAASAAHDLFTTNGWDWCTCQFTYRHRRGAKPKAREM